jgi:hypothetical protein
MSQYGTLSPSGMAPTGCLLVWVDLPGEGDGASCRFRQRRPNPREEPGALAALVGIWAARSKSAATEIVGLDVLLRDEH